MSTQKAAGFRKNETKTGTIIEAYSTVVSFNEERTAIDGVKLTYNVRFWEGVKIRSFFSPE